MSGRPSRVPVEPAPTHWELPDVTALGSRWAGRDLIAAGADLEPGTLLAAYRGGLFPMRVEGGLGWWSPDPRGVLPLEALRVSRSLRTACRRSTVTVDRCFVDVVRACGAGHRPDGWITEEFVAAYSELHRLGWAHSVEVWRGDAMVGGLYGVSIGGLFAGESMFHEVHDASKVALVGLVRLLAASGGRRLLDVQWLTPHLASLGAAELPRRDYLDRLGEALELPPPARLLDPPDVVVTES